MVLVPVFAFAKPNKNDKVLISQGVKLCQRIKAKIENTEYMKLFAGDPAIGDEVQELCEGDFVELESVTRFRLDEKVFLDLYKSELPAELKKWPPELKKELIDGLTSSFASIWNGRLGSSRLVASSVLTTSSVFDVNFSFDKYIYIFKYKDSFPICVVYQHGEDKAVSATASIVFDDDCPERLLEYMEVDESKEGLVTLEKLEF